MAETLAHYSFLPWFRQGLDTQIVEKDTLGAGAGTTLERAQLDVSIVLRAAALDGISKHDQTISKKINVIGPGDIKNISERVIVRVNPARNVSNYEANNLAYIEFYEEDFLWRYTPAGPDLKRLRPWLALVVLKDDEYTEQYIPEALPFVTVLPDRFLNAFHDPAQSWAFGHVHFNQVLESTLPPALINEVTAELKADPDTAVSRLLCPRKLNKNTRYTAFLIPAFETGRRSGIGLETTGVTAQETSWVRNVNQGAKPRPYDFPVYYQWRFSTGNDGDFESLVAKLKPIIMKPESGMMPMDVQEVGYGMDGMLEDATVGMEAALRPPTFELVRKIFPETANETEVQDQLKTFLNLSPSINQPKKISENINTDSKAYNPFYEGSLTDDPMIVPPLYGAWHSMAEDLKTGNNYPWFLELNLDFRNRAAAGLGTKVIQKEQEGLVNRAWQQVDKINEANQKIIEAEFSKLINNAIYKKHLNGAPDDTFLTVTAAMQGLTLTADKATTIKTVINESRIPLAAQSAGFLKISRSVKKFKTLNLKNNLLTNFNKDGENVRVTAARLKTAPGSAIPLKIADAMVADAISFYISNPINAVKDVFLGLLNGAVDTASMAKLKSSIQTALNGQAGVTPSTKVEVDALINNIQSYNNGSGKLEITLGKASYEKTFDDFSAGKTYSKAKILNVAMVGNPAAKIMPATTIDDIKGFQTRLTGMFAAIEALPEVELKGAVADLNAVRTNVSSQIKPDFALDRRVRTNIKTWDGLLFKPVKELKTAMAYPEFPEPGYEYLEKISQNFILPNVEKLPVNSITLLETNQRFIEAYMAGLNHEMARELLWREFPTDQRGSYFRQFWNITDNLADDNPADPDDKKDIKPMDAWLEQLGKHRPGFSGDILVLVVRGEVFNKYPNTVVYAQKATYDVPANKSRLLSDPAVLKFPLFSAELKPDIMLFGFELTAEQANGDRIESAAESPGGKNPGWFFVFKERPGHVQFGLDDFTTETADTTSLPAVAPATWNDFTWEHMVAKKSDLENYQLDVTKTINITDANVVKDKYSQQVPLWSSNAAEIASILYQDPILFARHAGEMLNEDLLATT